MIFTLRLSNWAVSNDVNSLWVRLYLSARTDCRSHHEYRYHRRPRPRAKRGALKQEPAIVANNGRAQNLIVNVSGMGIDEVVDLARSMLARASLSSLRSSARRQGLGELSTEDIDAEVAVVRAAR